jgi:hypothetical protein
MNAAIKMGINIVIIHDRWQPSYYWQSNGMEAWNAKGGDRNASPIAAFILQRYPECFLSSCYTALRRSTIPQVLVQRHLRTYWTPERATENPHSYDRAEMYVSITCTRPVRSGCPHQLAATCETLRIRITRCSWRPHTLVNGGTNDVRLVSSQSNGWNTRRDLHRSGNATGVFLFYVFLKPHSDYPARPHM